MRERYYLICLLFSVVVFSLPNDMFAQQVTFDNNAVTANSMATNPTINNFMAPAGADRLLVVVFSAANSSSTPNTPQITFGTDMLEEGASSEDGAGRKTVTYFLKLGSGGAVTNNIAIVGGTNGAVFFRRLTAFTLQGVDQTNPVATMANATLSGTATNLPVTNTPNGSLAIESLILRPNGGALTSATPQSGQSFIGASPPPNAGSGNFPVVSRLLSAGGNISLDWAFDPMLSQGVHTAMVFAPVNDLEVAPADPIPTMSQWGLIIFGLLVLNLGLMMIRRWSDISNS